jgi:hypothetical protein
MKFSLKTLLISMCLLGALFGVMSRLLMENPEMFLAVVRVGSTVGPFALATATIVWIGLRGSPRSRGLILWGCILLLTPFIAGGLVMMLWPAGNPLQMLTTERLISKRLSAQIETPWVWRELDRRLKNKELSKAEVDDAIEELTAHMKRTTPGGWNQPLSWQRDFIKSALQADMISDDTFIALCEAFFGPAPTVQLVTPTIEADFERWDIRADYGNPWADNSGLDVALLWRVTRVLVDNTPQTISNNAKNGNQTYVTIERAPPPGEYAVNVEFECAIVDASRLLGADEDALPIDQWPKARKRWTTTLSVPLRVVAGPPDSF